MYYLNQVFSEAERISRIGLVLEQPRRPEKIWMVGAPGLNLSAL